jgi:radical SAM superfamily enzyme YgiQ (UPF0313 family)
VTGDAYVDHPSFGMAIIGRLLEAQGFRVGIIAQPDWTSAEDFQRLGRPNLFFGVTAGNMDSMVNRYTSDRRIRRNDAYTPNDEGGRRPDRAVIVYTQRCREAFKDTPVIIGGIEASLRRIAHYDYWSEKVRRSVLLDARADLLLYGNAERALVEVAHRVAKGEHPKDIQDLRGTAFMRDAVPGGFVELDSTELDTPGKVDPHPDPYAMVTPSTCESAEQAPDAPPPVKVVHLHREIPRDQPRDMTVVRLPSFDQVKGDPVLYAHASRLLHLETNPGNARALVQRHGDKEVWLNPPPIPLTTAGDGRPVRPALCPCPAPGLRRCAHPRLGDDPLLGEHHARLFRRLYLLLHHRARGAHHPEPLGGIRHPRDRGDPRQGGGLHRRDLRPGRSHRQHVPHRLQGREDRGQLPAPVLRVSGHLQESQHRSQRPDPPVPPGAPGARGEEGAHRLGPALRPGGGIPGVREGAGDPPRGRVSQDRPGAHGAGAAVPHDEAGHGQLRPVQGPVRQVLERGGQGAVPDPVLHRRAPGHHRRGHDEPGPVAQAQRFSRRPGAGLPAGPHGARHRHVPLGPQPAEERAPQGRREVVQSPKGLRQRRLHKAFLRYHDPENWPLLREALEKMGRADLIGNGKRHLVPRFQPAGTGRAGGEGKRVGRKHRPQKFRTQHTRPAR